jgi:hypothetical protein
MVQDIQYQLAVLIRRLVGAPAIGIIDFLLPVAHAYWLLELVKLVESVGILDGDLLVFELLD